MSAKRPAASTLVIHAMDAKRTKSDALDEYYPSTSIPVAGWMQSCRYDERDLLSTALLNWPRTPIRYCKQWTSGYVTAIDGSEVAVCSR